MGGFQPVSGADGRIDVVILGAGSPAAAAVDPLCAAGRSVAVVSAGRVGGECSYVAAFPATKCSTPLASMHSWRRCSMSSGAPRLKPAHKDGARVRRDCQPHGLLASRRQHRATWDQYIYKGKRRSARTTSDNDVVRGRCNGGFSCSLAYREENQ